MTTITVAQCVLNYYPFVADQICRLKRYGSVILSTRTGSSLEILGKYVGLRFYAPYADENPFYQRLLTRTTNRLFGLPWNIRSFVRRHNIGLFHAHMGHQGVEFLPFAQRLSLPLLTSFHGTDAYAIHLYNDKYYNGLNSLFCYGNLFTVVSDHMKNRLVDLGCPREKIIVHHVGVDLKRFNNNYGDKTRTPGFRILCVTSFVENKGISYLVRALLKVKQRFPAVHLKIVGEAIIPRAKNEKKKVIQLIKKLGLEDAITLAGFIPYSDILEVYQKADIFVLPSITAQDGAKEGVPTVLMEAQAMGMPVVSTYLTGIPEVVVDGKSGLLVPEKDVDALAEKICYLFDHREEWERMGKVGRAHISEHFDLATQIDRLESIYDSLVI